jgi:hypothetical protein
MQEEMRRRTREAPVVAGCGKAVVGYAGNETRKEKPETDLPRNLSDEAGKRFRQAEVYCERESPPDAIGEAYEA